MESLLPIFFGIIILCVIFISSLLAKMFKAKRFKVYWMVLPWITALIAIVAGNIFQLDGLYVLFIGLSTFVFSLILINDMHFTSAATITTTAIASLALFLIAGGYALNQSGTDTRTFTSDAVGFIPQSEFYDFSFLETISEEESWFFSEDDESTVSYSDDDLLPNRVSTKHKLKSSVYRVVSPRKAGAFRGSRIRLLKHDGKMLKGSLVGVEGNKLIIGRYISKKGMIKAPIHMELIKKLEVLIRK